MKPKTLQEAVLDLPPNERADLARKLLEAEQRAGEIDRGEVEPISAEEARRKARALLR